MEVEITQMKGLVGHQKEMELEIERLVSENNELKAANENVKDIEELKQANSEMEAALHSSDAQVLQLKDLVGRQNGLESEIERLMGENEAAQSHVKQFQEKEIVHLRNADELKQTNDQLNAEIKQLKAAVGHQDELESELARVIEESELVKSQLKEFHEREIAHLKDLEELRQTIGSLEASLGEAEAEIVRLKKLVGRQKELESEVERIVSENEKLKEAKTQIEVRHLNDIEELKQGNNK
jgi:chromosome segregation ATPase